MWGGGWKKMGEKRKRRWVTFSRVDIVRSWETRIKRERESGKVIKVMDIASSAWLGFFDVGI